MSERVRETSREEDDRNDEERDLEEGWPYADRDIGRQYVNEAYGAAPMGPGRDAIPGTVREAIDDDSLEDEISSHFSDRGDIDERQITVTVKHGVAKLSGSVETARAAALAVRITAAVPGVRAVYNLLVPVGIDSHSDAS